jgi:DNA polymerase elongation subunit (family B)
MHDYNLNDVLITEKLFEYYKDKLILRYNISKKYNVNAYSEPDSGIANRLLDKFYSESTGLPLSSFKDLRTEREFITFNRVVFPNVTFKTDLLEDLLEKVMGHTYYKTLPFFKKPIVYKNIKYTLGIGGLHSSDPPGVFAETDKEYIIDCDVTSMYPNLITKYEIYPEHLGVPFIKKYSEILEYRVEAKKNGDDDVSDAFKIILNSTYGKMKSKHHWLYDPLAALRVTINGQLFLLMLIEDLSLAGFEVISANTDGVLTKVSKERLDEYYKICNDWSTITLLDLEYTFYIKYISSEVF